LPEALEGNNKRFSLVISTTGRNVSSAKLNLITRVKDEIPPFVGMTKNNITDVSPASV
jgi:hypothetical protein